MSILEEFKKGLCLLKKELSEGNTINWLKLGIVRKTLKIVSVLLSLLLLLIYSTTSYRFCLGPALFSVFFGAFFFLVAELWIGWEQELSGSIRGRLRPRTVIHIYSTYALGLICIAVGLIMLILHCRLV